MNSYNTYLNVAKNLHEAEKEGEKDSVNNIYFNNFTIGIISEKTNIITYNFQEPKNLYSEGIDNVPTTDKILIYNHDKILSTEIKIHDKNSFKPIICTLDSFFELIGGSNTSIKLSSSFYYYWIDLLLNLIISLHDYHICKNDFCISLFDVNHTYPPSGPPDTHRC